MERQITIAELNKIIQENGGYWVAESNPISELDDETKKLMMGNILLEEKDFPILTAAQQSIPSGIPNSIDWRNNNGNFVTSVKSQGKCGSCVGFGSTAAMESAIAIENPSILTDLSVGDAFFCSSHTAVCTGWKSPLLFQANTTRGICQDVLFPYSQALPAPQSPVCIINPNRGTNEFTYANINTAIGLNDTLTYLANTGPIAAGFTVYQDFHSYKSGVYIHVWGSKVGGHCICIVGYCVDSSIPGGGYYICKNSWKETWGDDGYFNIAFGQCDMDVNTKSSVTGIVLPPTIYPNS
jgi:C1A family cysteine protease